MDRRGMDRWEWGEQVIISRLPEFRLHPDKRVRRTSVTSHRLLVRRPQKCSATAAWGEAEVVSTFKRGRPDGWMDGWLVADKGQICSAGGVVVLDCTIQHDECCPLEFVGVVCTAAAQYSPDYYLRGPLPGTPQG